MVRCCVSRVLVVALCVVFGAACGDSYKPGDDPVVVVNNQMGEPAGSAELEVGFASGPLLEGGSPVTVQVALKRAPASPVTVTVSSSNEEAATAAPASLLFDTTNWSTKQTVTVTPIDDEVATGDKAFELRFELASDDPEFSGKPVSPLKLNLIDNDAAPTIVAAPVGAPQTTEQGGSATISIQLSRQPDSDVLIPVQVSDPAEAEVSAATLTFTTLNWNIAQQVVVTGKDDMQKDGDTQYKVVFGAANSADEEFNGIGPAEVTLINIDGVCGNGVVDGDEPCEPTGENECEFGQMDCMVCNNSCELVPGDVTGYCGDGVTQSDKGEECDEPTRPCEYGEMSCMVCGPQCKRIAGQVSGFCGDGQTQAADGEACDEPEAPCVYGQMSCMTCRGCQRVAGQVSGFCGDGQVQASGGEECDGAPTQTCSGNGVITCSAQCKNDASSCFSISKLAAGGSHSCAILQGGALRCWGNDEQGQLGVPSHQDLYSSQPLLVTGVTGAASVAAGSSHTCAVLTNGQARCWGTNGWGQLGDGTSTTRANPAAVSGLGSGVAQISAGDTHTCAALTNGQARCWGLNLDGQLGTGETSGNRSTPQTVVSTTGSGQLTGVAQISAGSDYTCAVLTSGQARCWGDGADGKLGVGSTSREESPAAVTGITDATQIAAGSTHTCAVLSSGQVRCWGRNWSGGLGDGTTDRRLLPVPVSGITNATQVGVGYLFSCALLSSGQIKCWGDNERGQLGDGTKTPRLTPVTVSGITNATSIAVGSGHVCAVLQSGEGRCWGWNTSGALTQPDTVFDSATPVSIAF